MSLEGKTLTVRAFQNLKPSFDKIVSISFILKSRSVGNPTWNGIDFEQSLFSVNITALDEHEMAQALVGYQPVSIAFEVVSDFMHYKDGVYSSTDCKVRTFILNRP